MAPDPESVRRRPRRPIVMGAVFLGVAGAVAAGFVALSSGPSKPVIASPPSTEQAEQTTAFVPESTLAPGLVPTWPSMPTTTVGAPASAASRSAAPVAASAPLPPLPSGWPATLQLGMADAPGGAQVMRSTAPFGFRYQYLAGGVNTGHGWSTWDPDGAFVSSYVAESRAAGIVPVFSYYMLTQSNPGAATGGEPGTIANLKDRSTMSAYYADLQLFFARARAVGGEVVLHVEPDLWGFMEHEARSDDAATVPVVVGSSGVSAVAGLPDTAAGLAQAIVRLRDADAPNVMLAYHASPWAAGTDILYAKPADATVAALGVRSANFYRSLGARFDLAFTDLTDRDAAFKQFVYHDGGASWYSPDDYRRNTIFIANFVHTAGIRAALWQVPLGNTKMRADNNTTGHYQDNKVEWLLDDAGRAHLLAYARAGVIAVLFGGGATGTTCACDADHDGVTNPPPINGNTGLSLSADDDGGFFRNRAASYYSIGALPIGG